MNSSEESLKKRKSNAGGQTAAGGGIGTLLILWAESLNEGDPRKSILIYIAPWVSVVSSLLWSWCLSAIEDWRANRNLKSLVRKQMEVLKAAIEDPRVSEEKKQEYRKKLEETYQILIDKGIGDIQENVRR